MEVEIPVIAISPPLHSFFFLLFNGIMNFTLVNLLLLV